MKQFNNNQILQDFQLLSIPGLEISMWFFIRLTSKQIRNCFTVFNMSLVHDVFIIFIYSVLKAVNYTWIYNIFMKFVPFIYYPVGEKMLQKSFINAHFIYFKFMTSEPWAGVELK